MGALHRKLQEIEKKRVGESHVAPVAPTLFAPMHPAPIPHTFPPPPVSSGGGGEGGLGRLEPLDAGEGGDAPSLMVFAGGEGADDDFEPGDTCLIAPVGVGGGGGVAENVGLGMGLVDPVLHQMMKNLKPPKFDDTPENWPSFIWDFERYLKKK